MRARPRTTCQIFIDLLISPAAWAVNTLAGQLADAPEQAAPAQVAHDPREPSPDITRDDGPLAVAAPIAPQGMAR